MGFLWVVKLSLELAKKTVLRGLGKFTRTHRAREFVEYAIDETMTLFSTEHLGQFDGFIDSDAMVNLRALHQLIAADAQNRTLDRINLRQRPIQEGCQGGIDFRDVQRNFPDQLSKILQISLAQILMGQKSGGNPGWLSTSQLPFVQCLSRATA